MKLKLIAVCAFALSAAAGSAWADTSALDNPEWMSRFYTDSSMKTMKGDDEFKAAAMGMTDEQRATIKAECSHDTVNHSAFCGNWAKVMGSM